MGTAEMSFTAGSHKHCRVRCRIINIANEAVVSSEQGDSGSVKGQIVVKFLA